MRALVLGLVLAASCVAEDVACPEGCRCGPRAQDGEQIAKCSLLDPDTQRFPHTVRHFFLHDGHLLPSAKGEYTLDEKVFLRLGLDNVKTISIVNSSLSSVDANAFRGLHPLSEVDLSDNNIERLHADTFKGNFNLKRLRLSGNPLTLPVGNSSEEYFLWSESLKEIDLSRCGFRHLSPAVFSRIDNLDVLSLAGNALEELNEEDFRDLALVSDLDLSDNRISKIHSDAFFPMEELHTLDLSGNPLETLTGVDLSDLRELDVSGCRFRALEPETLDGLSQVTHLNLSYNAITTLDREAFEGFSELENLYLGGNRLRGPLPEDLFENNKKLEVISLAGNRDLRRLRQFRGDFDRLYHVDLSDCGLTDVAESTFKVMPYLANLNLSRNLLEELPEGVLAPLKHLNVLDLSHNRLRTLPTLRQNRELSRVCLGDNRLHEIDSSAFSTNTKLVSLDLRRNPFKCSAEFVRTVEWLIGRGVKPDWDRSASMTGEATPVTVAWDRFTSRVCPSPDKNLIRDRPDTEEDVITVTVQGSGSTTGRFEKLEIVDVETRFSMWPVLLIAVICMCVLFVLFNLVGLLVSRTQRRYNLVTYKSQLPSPLGGRVRQPTGGVPSVAGHHVYHKLYEECSVPNTPAPAHKSFVAYLTGALNRQPPEQV
ncbi:hypothetical protein AAG570_002637 [Ranatra chinensis]|uniref:Uncharacterized protein n=1 Tax=Ranatra chinensis TaxID=642074 RepID=A0ABD0Y857_9HEMI